MNTLIETIVDAGIQAPSGENAQPWKFKVEGDIITIINLPERDDSLYSFDQHGALVGHGAMLENMIVAARHMGKKLSVRLFPFPDEPQCFAQVSIAGDETIPSVDLYPAVHARCTNRKKYLPVTLATEQLDQLKASAADVPGIHIYTITDPEKIKQISHAAAINEQVLFENQAMHSFFFDHITWTEEEDRKRSMGFYYKTLELEPPQVKAFKFFQNWRALQFLNHLGVSKFIAQENAKVYASASALVLLVADTTRRDDYLYAGQALERVWLLSTLWGYSAQPLTGVLFLHERIKHEGTKNLSEKHAAIIGNAYQQIMQGFGVSAGTGIMMLRVGNGGNPSARSTRLPPAFI